MSKSIWDELYTDPSEALDKKQRCALLINIVREARKLDQSLAQLAETFGVSMTAAQSIMAGHMDKFDVETLTSVCKNLGVDPETILRDIP
jgi:Helix-turn-helix.